jgi:PPE-repeat protein
MDFGIYPPEINSGRMYAGPGSGPLLAAAQAWAALADELDTAASAYQSVVSELTAGLWTGPASASMTAAAASYVEWLSSTASQVEETATQAIAAVAAYETAFAMTVPPAVIAANRSLLAALVATNFFGQNTSAIAATEAQYAEMWAQDVVAMYNYAGSSAAATALTPLTSPQQNTSPGASVGQAAAVSQALSMPAGDAQDIVSSVPQTFSVVPDALQSLATPAQSTSASSFLSNLSNLITVVLGTPSALAGVGVSIPLATLSGPVDLPFGIIGTGSGFHTDEIVSGWDGVAPWPGTGPAPVTEFPATLTNLPPGTVPTVSAGLGTSDTVGALSVPSAWTVAAPEVRPIALALPVTGIDPTAAAPLEAGSSTTLGDFGLAGMTGRAMAGPSSSGGSSGGMVTGARVPARTGGPAAVGGGDASHRVPRIVVTGVAAKIREITKLRDEGQLTQEDYIELKNRLLGR